ncbi:MAG: Fe-S cluster assembly protein SufD [Bacteroidia bacterium]
MTPKEYKEQLLDQYADFKSGINGSGQQPFYKEGEIFYNSIKELDFPSRRHEEWKYTTLDRVLKHVPKLAIASASSSIEWLTESEIPNLDTYKVILVNGKLSTFDELPTGVILESAKDGDINAATPADDSDIFENINRAFATDAISINVKANACIDKPILIVNAIDALADAAFVQRNINIHVEKSAEVTFIERQLTNGANTSLSNSLTQISVEANANVHHIVLQNDGNNASQVARTYVSQHRDSVYSNYTYSLSGEIIRNNLNISLDQENTIGNMYGLYLLAGKEHVDNHSVVDHKVPNCESNELYKGVLNDNSIGVFNGKVFVRQDAQKTNAYQQNRNLLLSDNATINTKPQLEIWADDVKCSHGCTVGQLDDEQLFYLRSRGIDTDSAKALMVYAFASEIVEKLPVEALKAYLFDAISRKLGFNLE